MLRRVRHHIQRHPSLFAEVYELDCGHRYSISDVELRINGARALQAVDQVVDCHICDKAALLPDTVSECFRIADEGGD